MAASRTAAFGFRLEVVCGNAATGDWNCASRLASDGGPLCVHSVDRVVRGDRLGSERGSATLERSTCRASHRGVAGSDRVRGGNSGQYRVMALEGGAMRPHALSATACESTKRNEPRGRIPWKRERARE